MESSTSWAAGELRYGYGAGRMYAIYAGNHAEAVRMEPSDTTGPCGVLRSLASRVPSGSASADLSHRFTCSTTHRWAGVTLAWTALTIRS